MNRTASLSVGAFLCRTRLFFIVALSLFAIRLQAATDYVEGEVIVTFKPAATLESARATLRKKALVLDRHFARVSAKRKRAIGLVRDTTKSTVQLIAELKDDPEVESVEPNYLRWISAAPNDTRFAELWGLRNTGQTVNGTAGTASADVKFVEARELARNPVGQVVVGVIDSGVDYVHPDLAANMWVNTQETPRNGIDDDGNGYVDDVNGYDFSAEDADPSDSGDHGTHVAGTIGALGDNQCGIIGVNDKVRIVALKVSNNGTSISTSATIEAIEYAAALKSRGVNIVALNASYGGGGFSNIESAAIQTAGDAGIILCAAAGNESANNDSTLTYPASYRLSNMLVVAATDQNDALASYSNYGAASVDLAAPGSNILSTRPSTVSFRAGSATCSSTELTFTGTTTGVSGQIVDCGNGNTAAQFPAAVNGNIALIQRGTETFATKVTNARNAGATAAIIYNNVSGSFAGTLGGAGNWIPARSISLEDGQAIKAALPQSGAIVVTGNYQFLNGTSMATPHVTGAIGFAAMNFPQETVAARRQRIVGNVDSKPGLQGKVITGGRLNLLRLVDSNADAVPDWRPTIVTTALPLAIHGEAYAQTLVATGGIGPYVWSVAAGALPTGLTLSSAGSISGTSSVTGEAAFTVLVTDSSGATDTQPLALRAAATGPLDHFAWDYQPAEVYAATPFAVRISARDAAGRVISEDATVAQSTVNLTASAAGGPALNVAPSSVVLSGGEFVGYLSVTPNVEGVILKATQGAVIGTASSVSVKNSASTANDGLPDSWKTAYGLSVVAHLASVDSDGDGLTNRQEFFAGTNPASASSSLQISNVNLTAGAFTFHFPGVAGKLYQISETADFVTWTPRGPRILTTANGPKEVALNVNGETRLFFRVEIVP